MLNGAGEYGEFSKIFDTTDLGYREIRVERPLRLSFQVTTERISRLRLDKIFLKIDAAEQESIVTCLESQMPTTVYRNNKEFEKALAKAMKGAGIKLAPPIKKTIISTLSKRDSEADVCRDSEGKEEPDPELRDSELVPLKEDWKSYFAREVTPFVSDAWVDQDYRDQFDGHLGRVGYEINFNRYFYQDLPPRSLRVIQDEMKKLEAEIERLLIGTAE